MRAEVMALLAGASPTGERIHERTAAILAQREYQTALPVHKELSLPNLPHINLDLARVLQVILIAAVVVAVVLAAVWLFRRLRSGGDRDGVQPEPSAADAMEGIPSRNADRLAAEGRYGEAIHVLLLETLAALSAAARLAPSLTSREIAAGVPLAPMARDALAGLVAAVEISLFGGTTPGEPDYQACVARFNVFLDSYRSAA